ncbi:MAG: GRP family sugar transporter [Nanoarchaeota archaeon]|nr:GRP family sugar transporter [Nanoarchaeota archaeon]
MINFRKTKITLLLIVLIQIFLLMNMNIAESYLIHQTDEVIGRERKIQEEKDLIDIGLNLLIGIFSIKQIGIVSAEEIVNNTWEMFSMNNSFTAEFSLDDVTWNCCPQTINGAICQDISSLTPGICASEPLPTKCENIAECKSGCCFDSVEGLCTTNSPKQECVVDGGKWNDNAYCLIQECQRGCCVIGSESQFATETRCKYISSIYGYEKDFRDIQTELECILISASQFLGACIVNDVCSIETEQECLSYNGRFFQDYLCSHPSLETDCTKQNSTGCYEGKDEIYWFDSCGNKENIYSSDKEKSWNNGRVLIKENSCNSDSSNAGSETCGNCNYYAGSICSETKAEEIHILEGNYVCKDLKCRYTDEWGGKVVRENGESWCVYDGYIGDGKDAPGSRHWKRMCINGEIKVEPCADYRGQICAQTIIEEGDVSFSMASCVVNEAFACIAEEGGMGGIFGCEFNKDCMIKHIYIDEYFHFDQCVPRYPRGFDLKEDSVASSLCGIANNKCTIYYEKSFSGNWKCIENCDCEGASFTNQLNDLCISLGDCGGSVNYLYSEPVKGQYVEPKEIREDLGGTRFGRSETYGGAEESGLQKGVETLGTIMGSLAFLAVYYKFDIAWSLRQLIGGMKGIKSNINSYGTAITCAALGAMVGAYFAKYLEISGDAATAMTLSGAAMGVALWVAFKFTEMGNWYFIHYNWIGVIIMALIILYIWYSGWGKTKTKVVNFNCNAWQAPTGGKDCDKCDDDVLKPCSKYRCESLGQACVLLNENEENPVCQAITYEPNPPIISAGEILSIGYGFFNENNHKVEIRKQDGECIPEFTPVLFTLKTDENAQCKYYFEKKQLYEDFENYPVEGTSFGQEHSFAFSMPSLDSFNVYNVTGDLKEMFGNTNMYIKCIDYHGNYNLDNYNVNFCINSGPDLTPATVVYSEPVNHAFIKYNTTEVPLTIYVSEPAECRLDIEDKNYDELLGIMECDTEVNAVGLYGWECNTILTDLNSNENTIYIRCKDQPWKTDNDSLRNINSESYTLTLHKTETPLKIYSVSPQGEIEAGFEPISVELEAKTSGGSNNGKSTCYYQFSETEKPAQFFNTFSELHTQTFDMMSQGNYNLLITCEDNAGNLAYENAIFNLNVDSSAPIVVRVYNEASKLKLITDEKAECYYDLSRCNFDLNNATAMTTFASTEHSAVWSTGQTYYIKCQDVWENSNPSCAIVVNANKLGG